MIIRDEWDNIRLDGPRPFYVPIYPIFPQSFSVEETDIPIRVSDWRLVFAPEYDESVNESNVYVRIWDVPWRWYCQSCYAAYGDKRDVFKTDGERREDFRGTRQPKAGRLVGSVLQATTADVGTRQATPDYWCLGKES